MIYTLTLNPALDYVVTLDKLRTGTVNRSRKEAVFGGGKGINVSAVLCELGIPNIAMGFTAGFTGEEIERAVHAAGVQTDFIRLEKGMSRINLKLRADEETEINAAGPKIDGAALEELFVKLSALREGDFLVLAGSVPSSLSGDIYERIMKRLLPARVNFVVDATGDLLRSVLKYRPFLIKPNHHELGELFGVSLRTAEETAEYAKRLQEQGARNVLVSMAGEGAVLLTEDGNVRYSRPPEGKVVYSVGAGDSMVAGFLAGWLNTGDMGHAFRMGLAAGSASAFSATLATRSEVEDLLRRLE